MMYKQIVERRQINVDLFPVWCKHALYLDKKETLTPEENLVSIHLNGVLKHLITREEKKKTPPGKRTYISVLAFEMLIQCKHLDPRLRKKFARIIRIIPKQATFELR